MTAPPARPRWLHPRSGISALVLGAALAGCTGGSNAVTQGAGGEFRFVPGNGESLVVEPGKRELAPAVRGETLEGTPYDIGSLRGSVVVLNFWASWCGPCRAEAPALEDAYQASKARGVQFVGVNVKDNKAEALAFQRSTDVSYPSLHDQPGSVAARFRGKLPPSAIPSTLLLDRQGRVAALFTGPVGSLSLRQQIDRLAGEPA